MATSSRKRQSGAAGTFSKDTPPNLEMLSSDPLKMVFANRVLWQNGLVDYFGLMQKELAQAKTPEEMKNLVIKYDLLRQAKTRVVANLFSDNNSQSDIANKVAALITGDISATKLEQLDKDISSQCKSEIIKNYQSKIIEELKNNPRFKDEVSSQTVKKITRIATRGLGVFGVFCAATILFHSIFTDDLKNNREDALRPVYSEIQASKPAEAMPTIEDYLVLGVSDNLTAVDYSTLSSVQEAADLYTAAIGMPENSGEFGSEISKELLDNKILVLEDIISAYPDSLEAYLSQYQIYLLKSFNQNFYSTQDITSEIDLLITQYPNLKDLSTKRLVELIDDYLSIATHELPEEQATQATLAWIKDMATQAGENTYAYYKLNYILASIYSGQQELIPVSDEDKLTIISLPSLLMEYSGGASEDEITNLYMESANGNNIRSSIGNYSLALYLLEGADLNSRTPNIAQERLIIAANYFEDAIAASEGYPEYETYWVADAMYNLAQISTQLGQFEYAQQILTELNQKYPDNPIVVKDYSNSLYTDISDRIQDAEYTKEEQQEIDYQNWLSDIEKQISAGN